MVKMAKLGEGSSIIFLLWGGIAKLWGGGRLSVNVWIFSCHTMSLSETWKLESCFLLTCAALQKLQLLKYNYNLSCSKTFLYYQKMVKQSQQAFLLKIHFYIYCHHLLDYLVLLSVSKESIIVHELKHVSKWFY